MKLTIDEHDHIVGMRGDKDQPLSRGYACFKGLQAEEAHHSPARLLRPLMRLPDGRRVEVPLNVALDEIADRMRRIIDEDGGRAVGLFCGAGAFQTATAHPMLTDFLAAIGSDQFFTTVTIDQSAKLVALDRLGAWSAGLQDLHNSDVVVLWGTNPLVSHATLGLLVTDPTRRMKQAKANGLTVIAIDPRRTESARYAELFLQPLPGHDAAIAAAILRVILTEGWHDADFCARYVGAERMTDLRAAVDLFIEEAVEARAGLEAGQVRAVATLFARDNKRGAVFAATGPSMAPHSNTTIHLVDCINVVCGRFRRSGERYPVSPLAPPQPIYAEVIAPPRTSDLLPPSRIRGISNLFGERLSATLADEILTPGEGRIRCMVLDGGNAANCIPGQSRIVEAFKALDLLVVIDPYMTASAQLADFVLPPPMMYERADLPLSIPGFALFPESWAQYTPGHIAVPAGSDLIDDWRFYWEIAARLGVQIKYDRRVPLDMSVPPTEDELLRIRLSEASVSLDELKRYPSGALFDLPHGVIQPARAASTGCFDVMPTDVAQELRAILAPTASSSAVSTSGRKFTHLLASRRLRHVFNSTGILLGATQRRHPQNPAYMNPADMSDMGIETGDEIEIASAYGAVAAIAQTDESLRRGVVSLAHGWGGFPGETTAPGSAVNILTSGDAVYEAVNAMPVMSALPVSIQKLGGPVA